MHGGPPLPSAENRTDWYPWRLVATGLCFGLFGLGGIVLSVAALLLGVRARRHPEAVGDLMRRLIQRSFQLFVAVMHILGVLRSEIHGGHKLATPGQLIVANHPSLVDIIFLIAFAPGVCVVKQRLLDSLTFGHALRRAGYIGNGSAERVIEECVARLRSGISVILFPEGTRTPNGVVAKLHRGAAYVAMDAAVDPVPVSIHIAPPTLGRDEPWYRTPPARIRYQMWVGNPIEHDRKAVASRRSKARVLTGRIHEAIWSAAPLTAAAA